MKKLFTTGIILLSFYITPLPAQTISTWSTLSKAPSSLEGRFEDIFFITPTQGWAISISGILYRTTDGNTWSTAKAKSNLFGTRSIAFHDSLRGWLGVLDDNKPLFGTTDGGKSWTEVTNITGAKPKGICGLWVVNDSVVYGSGRYDDTARLIKTTDGGKSWKSIDLSAHAATLVDCYFTTPDSGIVTGGINGDLHNNVFEGNAIVLLTSDGGITWKNVYTSNRTGEQGWKIYFRTALEGYIAVQCAGSEKYYLKTIDGGKTWTEKLFVTNSMLPKAFPQGMAFVSEKHGWIGGWGEVTYTTEDGGENWQESSLGMNINRFRRINDTLTYVGGERIYTITTQTVNSIINDTDNKALLARVAPNPMQGTAILSFVAEQGTWAIQISDVLGRQVLQKNGRSINQEKIEMTLDLSDVPAGLHYCKVISGRRKTIIPMMIEGK